MSATIIKATDLEPGDTIVADGSIDLHVTAVHAVAFGFVPVAYESIAGPGDRLFVDGQTVAVRRAGATANCGALCAEMNAGHCPGPDTCIYAPREVAA